MHAPVAAFPAGMTFRVTLNPTVFAYALVVCAFPLADTLVDVWRLVDCSWAARDSTTVGTLVRSRSHWKSNVAFLGNHAKPAGLQGASHPRHLLHIAPCTAC